ncbi:hypothetical protein B7494_g445 [Chlorociboria aeruginascens]|nr:hypothetical protein B7494_g445 [Chlorociboria aeruginascens]
MIRSSHRQYGASTASQHFSDRSIFVRSFAAPLGVIIGPAVGGLFIFLTFIIILIVLLLRRKHRKKLRDLEGGPARNELNPTIRSTCPPEKLSRKLSYNPFSPSGKSEMSDQWGGDEDYSAGIEMGNLRTKRFAPEKGFFRVSGFRESWPLVSSMQVPTLSLSTSSSSKIYLSPVAPPGYVVNTDPTWPKRTFSRSSRGGRSIDLITQPQPFATETDGNFTVVKLNNQRHRSSSAHQLSSILRSTSDRLKPTQSQTDSLKRSFTTVSRLPGSPPKGRLPSPPVRKATESRELLIDHDPSESGNSSMFERYITKTPSPPKLIPRSAGNAQLRRGNSIDSFTDSDDSLCRVNTPDLVIPAQLTSPHKGGNKTEKRHQMRISSGGSKNTVATIQKNNRTSIFVPGNGLMVEKRGLSTPHRISLASDPFYSSVKSSKPVIPTTEIFGPRPLYIRKATFGQEATTERPPNFSSPLRDISGNVQTSTTKESRSLTPSDSDEPNPFQWSPQETIQMRASLTSPKRAGSQRRRGHKRSRVIRLSGLHRPPSVCVVPEEPEENPSPLRLHSRANSDFQILEPTKTSSPQASMPACRLSDRPPSTPNFNPCLNIPKLLSTSRDNSPTLEIDAADSPTLSICNYYAEHNSEEEFFDIDSTPAVKSRRHGHNLSEQISPETKTLSLFPSPSPHTTPELPGSPSLVTGTPAADRTSGITPPILLNAPLSLPAPPLLTIPVPAHLTGPRNPPRPRVPRDSLTTSIGILRRMNSEISVYSTVSSLNGDSPTIPDLQRITSVPSTNSIIGGRGSRNYLSIGSKAPKMSRPNIARTINELEALPIEEKPWKEFASMSSSPSQYLEPFSTPATGANALRIQNLRFPTLSSTGSSAFSIAPPLSAAPTSTPTPPSTVPQAQLLLPPMPVSTTNPATTSKESRWSSAMTKEPVRSIRRESKMKHPSPKTPPKWTQVDFLGEGQENEGKDEGSRPISAGWYDQKGFLKSSPQRDVKQGGGKEGVAGF